MNIPNDPDTRRKLKQAFYEGNLSEIRDSGVSPGDVYMMKGVPSGDKDSEKQ